MQITSEQKDNHIIIHLEGKLDSVTSADAENELKSIFEQQRTNLILNFEKLTYISSAGLRILLIMAKKAKASQVKLILVSLKREVYDVFKVSGLTKLFTIQDSISEAESSL